MPGQDDFTDSTDWLPTPLAALAPLDSSLRCQVCKDFFTTPMMTSCSHTFCSLCIRRYLSQEGRCPACRESDQEIKLRRNWAVEELVATFTASRKGLLGFATTAAKDAEEEDDIVGHRRPKKRRKVNAEPMVNGVERRSTRSQSKRMASAPTSQQSVSPAQQVIDDSEDEESIYDDSENKANSQIPNGTVNVQPNDSLVGCPCCHRRMKEALINSHLDKCIQGDSHTPVDDHASSSSPTPTNGTQIAPPGTIAYSQRKPSKHNERLPYINYNMFTDTKLRQKLKELGIPNTGSKDLMRRRHTEWVNLWNANCDSTQPVSKRDLLRELKVWEDTLGRQLEKPTTNSGFMAKEFDRDRHVRNQKGNFDDLIRQARERARASTQTPDQEDNTPSAVEGTASDADAADMDAENLEIRTNHTHFKPEIDTEHPAVTAAKLSGRYLEQDEMMEIAKRNLPTAAMDIPHSSAVLEGPDPQPAIEAGLAANPGTPSKRFFL